MSWSVFSTSDLAWTGQRSSPRLYGARPATNRMDHGRVNFWSTACFQMLVALYAMPDQNHRKNVLGNIKKKKSGN